MDEPDDLTGWVDKTGGTWVRVDDCPGRSGPWWPRTDGPHWDPRVHSKIGNSFQWEWMDDYRPFTEASPELTAETIALVRAAYAR